MSRETLSVSRTIATIVAIARSLPNSPATDSSPFFCCPSLVAASGSARPAVSVGLPVPSKSPGSWAASWPCCCCSSAWTPSLFSPSGWFLFLFFFLFLCVMSAAVDSLLSKSSRKGAEAVRPASPEKKALRGDSEPEVELSDSASSSASFPDWCCPASMSPSNLVSKRMPFLTRVVPRSGSQR